MKRFLGIAILLALLTSGLLLILLKPLRVTVPIMPSFVVCADQELCTDDTTKEEEARQLYAEALSKTAAMVGPFHAKPKVIFCSSDLCKDYFGLGERAAFSLGNFGIVVAPRGWKKFYMIHELIHHRQAEELGNLSMILKPSWLIEGMAYSLSNDPRPLSQPFRSWRSQFETWNSPSRKALWLDVGEVRSERSLIAL